MFAFGTALLVAAPVWASPADRELREGIVDATASSVHSKSVRLGDVTVLSLRDRTVKLRFAMAGIPPPPFSTTCGPGQALVSVRVNVLVVPRVG
jgi:hypothetical protein